MTFFLIPLHILFSSGIVGLDETPSFYPGLHSCLTRLRVSMLKESNGQLFEWFVGKVCSSSTPCFMVCSGKEWFTY